LRWVVIEVPRRGGYVMELGCEAYVWGVGGATVRSLNTRVLFATLDPWDSKRY